MLSVLSSVTFPSQPPLLRLRQRRPQQQRVAVSHRLWLPPRTTWNTRAAAATAMMMMMMMIVMVDAFQPQPLQAAAAAAGQRRQQRPLISTTHLHRDPQAPRLRLRLLMQGQGMSHSDDEWHPNDPAWTTSQLLEGIWSQIAQAKDMVKGVRCITHIVLL
jgi:hypothetical protein